MNNIHCMRDKKRSAKKLHIFLLIFIPLSIVNTVLSLAGYEVYSTGYQQDTSLVWLGARNLQMAEMHLKTVASNPFDAQAVSLAQREFAVAALSFVQVNSDLQSLPIIATAIPSYGPRLRAALDLLPVAIELSEAGFYGCRLLNVLIMRFHDPLNSNNRGLTTADFSVLKADFSQVKTALSLAMNRFEHVPRADWQVVPGLNNSFATFQRAVPLLQMGLAIGGQLLPVLPTLLGIGTPTNYLIEILDSTELRPGGGFLGSYGIATLRGGRLTSAPITDTYLLDNAYQAAGHVIPLPAAYRWFDLVPYWSLRDSNLDADFPTDARYAEELYQREGGKVSVQGVIAMTPTLIEHALTLTGPIAVPEYHEVVTSANLLDRIHYYLLGPGYQGGSVPSPDGLSSVNQHFVALLAEHFLARVRQLPPSVLSQFLQLMISSLSSKDLQIYLNASGAERLLHTYHVAASIEAPPGDSLFVVDTNIAGDKASNLLTTTLDDQVTLDAQGNAIHHTTITYAWLTNGQIYGSALYRDYVRVYVPPGSVLQTQAGWQPRGTSKAFGREVWAGFFTLTYGQTRTITLIWRDSGAATKTATGWHYQYLIQRQAGSQWTVHLRMILPPCAAITRKWGGLVGHNAGNTHTMTLMRSLQEDMRLGVDYVCR